MTKTLSFSLVHFTTRSRAVWTETLVKPQSRRQTPDLSPSCTCTLASARLSKRERFSLHTLTVLLFLPFQLVSCLVKLFSNPFKCVQTLLKEASVSGLLVSRSAKLVLVLSFPWFGSLGVGSLLPAFACLLCVTSSFFLVVFSSVSCVSLLSWFPCRSLLLPVPRRAQNASFLPPFASLFSRFPLFPLLVLCRSFVVAFVCF